MELYARVNILDGRSVRLPKGDINQAIALDNDPLGRVESWLEQGADRIHVVDLDAAAYGDYKNRDLIDHILDEVDGNIQVAGGIRSHLEAARLIEKGAWRIVMSTAAIEDQNMVWDLCRDYPGKIAIALDVRPDEEIATRGWTKNSGRYLEEVLIEMSSAGAAAFLVSEAGRDMLTEPPNVKILAEALATVEDPIIAAGGVRDLEDLRSLMGLSVGGRRLAGVIVGREVTQGRFTLGEAKATIAAGVEEHPYEGEEEPVRVTAPAPAGPSPPAPGVLTLMADAAAMYARIAEECREAAAHAAQAAEHFHNNDALRGAAHAFSVQGHLARAREELDELAMLHAEKSSD